MEICTSTITLGAVAEEGRIDRYGKVTDELPVIRQERRRKPFRVGFVIPAVNC
jgi:hypothetical protein